ncbi:hypothetical protein PYCC9005_002139 [Savitreella phatthalungensis]
MRDIRRICDDYISSIGLAPRLRALDIMQLKGTPLRANAQACSIPLGEVQGSSGDVDA